MKSARALACAKARLTTTCDLHISRIMEKMDAIVALGALAQESRLDVFRLLVQAGPDGMAAGQIGERLGLPSATLSFHLSQLKQAGLVTFRRESRSLIYMAEYDTMNALLGYLTENCCQGDAAGCGVGICDSATLTDAKKGLRQ
jgi:ArsR family transcriptional regulator, arsenate/arsenite/antimonite-responsive transcriptional repressor